MIDIKKLREFAAECENANQLARTLKSVLDEFDRVTAERDALRTESESLASNLRGKYSTAGATYAHLIAELDALNGDAERFRWITDDHQDPEVRTALLDLFERLPVMSYSAACAAIDAAIRASKGDA